MKQIKFFLISFILLLCQSANLQYDQSINVTNYITQASFNRTVAEWEPAIGTMVSWPSSLPHKLLLELAKDAHLFTLVANKADKEEAQKWYSKWGIKNINNTFIEIPLGISAPWIRDWGPSAVFTPNLDLKLSNDISRFTNPHSPLACTDSLNYKLAILSDTDDEAVNALGKNLKFDVLDLPFISTGGNFITDGLGTAFSTCILPKENKFQKISEEQFFEFNKKLLGIHNYHIISNFEKNGIQHIDCFMKLLDDRRILVAEPPLDHELYPIYNDIVIKELSTFKNSHGQPYEILRIKLGRYEGELLSAYTNALIVNNTVYVPLYQITEDIEAIQTWKEAMPGYTIKGFIFDLDNEPHISKNIKEHYTNGNGWKNNDALHCRTRALCDRNMVFISTYQEKSKLFVTIIDYSKKGLILSKCKVFWRVKGKHELKENVLIKTKNANGFYFDIPKLQSEEHLEYYISAKSKSGNVATLPKTAPNGFYQFSLD
jgi:agmatine deiminase